jgi:hypothetical protein
MLYPVTLVGSSGFTFGNMRNADAIAPLRALLPLFWSLSICLDSVKLLPILMTLLISLSKLNLMRKALFTLERRIPFWSL